ncbi:hypothetical protein [Komagataeibacter saccharivorans]|nr:hypothetical protein [Komagataeibacter saccharivorans]
MLRHARFSMGQVGFIGEPRARDRVIVAGIHDLAALRAIGNSDAPLAPA